MLKNAFLQIFTWWNGATLSTRLFTKLRGERVGEDEFGNVYYQTAGGRKDKGLGFVRRWVIYNGEAEGSRVPPGWSGWLQHRSDIPPSKEDYKPREWQLPHKPNMTGTAEAYRPSGSTLLGGDRQKADGDYKPWTPAG
jgi:NADH:ubiquinone oxidoreductase subunit